MCAMIEKLRMRSSGMSRQSYGHPDAQPWPRVTCASGGCAVVRRAQQLADVTEAATTALHLRLHAVREHHGRDVLHVVQLDPRAVLEGRQRLRALAHDDVGAVAVDIQLDGERGDAH